MRETANRWLCFKMPLLAMAIVGALFSSILASSPAAHPNIILFYTDDQGWSDSSVRMMAERDDSHKDMFKTPNLQRLANEGMVFSDAYASSPVCSSSRDSILYGMTPARLHHSILIGKRVFHAYVVVLSNRPRYAGYSRKDARIHTPS